ncbi:periplasmic nitrate reductase NapE [Saccharophagus degradans 2-40]|uniref:Periplasmic nitrate reductase NapE n=2 Tax=Saccharophagus degradans TaxID=86304 RepID=Q21PN3_SACD2|nr:periplasmic nitrate reductase NapE [Saccharophagus degradans 2-40]
MGVLLYLYKKRVNGRPTMSEMETDPAMQVEKRQERRMFMFITIVLFPLLSVMLVGGYGLLIWVSQMIWGPPTA